MTRRTFLVRFPRLAPGTLLAALTLHTTAQSTPAARRTPCTRHAPPAGQVAYLSAGAPDGLDQFGQQPVTEYCVEHLERDWAPYISCNDPEAAPRNTPADPTCMCQVCTPPHPSVREEGAACCEPQRALEPWAALGSRRDVEHMVTPDAPTNACHGPPRCTLTE